MDTGLVLFYRLVAKSLAPSNIKGHGKVPYLKPQLKSMAHGRSTVPETSAKLMTHGVHLCIAQCITQLNVTRLP